MAMHDWLTKDLGWKVFSLFLAVIVWLTVYKIREEPEILAAAGIENTYGNLPVHLLSATTDVHNYRIDPDTVVVTVSGPPKTMAVLQANQIHAMVNLTNIESSPDLYLPVEVSTPAGVTLMSVEPAEVRLIVPLAPIAPLSPSNKN
jgi:YbbR domain-containing protein